MTPATSTEIGTFWHVVGIVGGAIFYGRFYAQWIASERAGRSVMPVLFWNLSSIGSVLLMAFAIATRSPLGVLGQNFNFIVYGRNLTHIWRENGTLTPLRRHLLSVAMVVVVGAAVYALVNVWMGEFEKVQRQTHADSRLTWYWLAIGVAGQSLFAARFLVQWVATERQKRSVIPASFWYLSLVASVLQAGAYLHRQEWVFGVGTLMTILVYLRNILLVRQRNSNSSVREALAPMTSVRSAQDLQEF